MAIGFVITLVVRHKIVQGEAIMRDDVIDAVEGPARFFDSKAAVILSSFSMSQFTSPPIKMAKPVMYNHNIRITTAPKDP